jgi:TolA-binding protein
LFQSLTATEEPPDVAARGLSGLCWSRYKAGELEPAAAAFQQLLDRYPQAEPAAEAALVRGQILQRLKKPADALAMYRLLIDKYPQDERLPQGLLGAARLEDQLGQDEDAARLYERMIKEFPEHESLDTALYESAWVLRELNRPEESDARFQALYQDHRDSRYWADAAFRLAERAHAARRYEDAQRLLSELTASKPDQKLQPHVQYLQGQAAAGRQQWAEVIEAMRPLIDAADDSPFKLLARYWTAEALYRQGEFAAAGERLADLAVRVEGSREPWTAMVPLRQAQVLAQQKKWREAQELAESIASRWPEFDQQHEADYVIGRALAARGEFDDARAAYEKVIRSTTGGKTETAAMAQWMIGETYYHQKNYETALREYLRLEILYAYPTWQAAALLQAGKCSEQLGQWKQAAELYQRLVKDFAETSFVEEAEKRLIAARERLAGR